MVLIHKCMTVSWPWKCLCVFWGQTFCRITWGFPFLFLQSCWKTHPSALVEEKSNRILTNVTIIWNTKKTRKVCEKGKETKLVQSVAHFCSSEGLCRHSDPLEGKCVIQVESTPLPQCSLLLAQSSYPAALGDPQGDQRNPGSLAKTDVWNVCG